MRLDGRAGSGSKMFQAQIESLLKDFFVQSNSGDLSLTVDLVEPIHSAYTNHVYRITATLNGAKEFFLLRIFGPGKERGLLVSLDEELAIINLLQAHGLRPRVLHTFSNGRLEEYLPNALQSTKYSLRQQRQAIAKALFKFHSLVSPLSGWDLLWTKNSVLERCKRWSNQTGYRYGRVWAWLEDLEETFVYDLKHQTLVICHNDLQPGNILTYCCPGQPSQEDQSVTFVDFEYAGWGWAAYDIANHWCELMTNYDNDQDQPFLDETQWPSLSEQADFLQAYDPSILENVNKGGLESWTRMINLLVPLSDLYWGLWALVQAKTKCDIVFDYQRYAIERLTRWERMSFLE